MEIPTAMPVLSPGQHDRPEDGACIMEYASFLAGEEWTDTPACTHPLLARAAQVVNDTAESDAERARLLPLLGALMGSAAPDPDEERRVTHYLALRLLRHAIDVEAMRTTLGGSVFVEPLVLDRSLLDEQAAAARRVADEIETCLDGGGPWVLRDLPPLNLLPCSVGVIRALAASIINGYVLAPSDVSEILYLLNGAEGLEMLLDEHARVTNNTPREITADDLQRCVALTGQ